MFWKYLNFNIHEIIMIIFDILMWLLNFAFISSQAYFNVHTILKIIIVKQNFEKMNNLHTNIIQ